MRLVVSFLRREQPDDPYAFHLGREEYVLPGPNGGAQLSALDWDDELLSGLDAARLPGCDPEVLVRIGRRLRRFLDETSWMEHDSAIADAVARREPVFLTIRSAAAELYALPWELVPLGTGVRRLGALAGLLLRYAWPETLSAPAAAARGMEGGRILLAWAGAVPAAEHAAAIASAGAGSYLAFTATRDVLPQVSVERLGAALASGEPVSILHLLCHGAPAGATIGLAFERSDGSEDIVDAARLAELLGPHAGRLRLVVLCACESANPGRLGNQLGSIAQALHRAGIQSVVASRYPLSTEGSRRLTAALYGALLGQPASLEEAVLAAREALRSLPGVEWAGLQLYARPEDGDDTRPIVFRPYRGLLAFQPEHRRFFFGRDAEIRQVLDGLQALAHSGSPRFLIVAGASGTGKSSLVLAGAVPKLVDRPDAPYGLARIRPGSTPDAALDAAIASAAPAGRPLLVVVDQFEELFTGAIAPPLRDAFVQRLWRLASDVRSGVIVIITLRVDFLGRCGEVKLDASGLRLDRVAYDEAHRVFVAQLNAEGLSQAIEGPARMVGLQFEEGLTQRILTDVGAEPGALPLVEFALDQLWQRRHGRVLTQAAYDEIGGVAGALSQEGDRLLAGMTAAQRDMARHLLVQLVAMADDAQLDSRRRRPVANVRPTQPEAGVVFDLVLEQLVTGRLLVRDIEAGVPTVEVAHEALIRRWESLRAWLHEDRPKLAHMEKLRAWAAEWQQYPDALLRGDQLGYARQVRERWASELDDGVARLIVASEEEAQRQTQAAEARRRHELDLDRRRIDAERRRTRWVASAAVIVAAVVSIGGVLTWQASRRAEQAAERAQKKSQESLQRLIRIHVASGAQLLQTGDWTGALIGFAEALHLEPDPQKRWIHALRVQAVLAMCPQLLQVWFHKDTVYIAKFSPDGSRVVTTADPTSALIWDRTSGSLIKNLPHPSRPDVAAFSADGRSLLTKSWDHKIRIWDTQTWQLRFPPLLHDIASSAAFSSDSSRLVTVGQDKLARLWDLKNITKPPIEMRHALLVHEGYFSQDGHKLLTVSGDLSFNSTKGEARVWNAETGVPITPPLLHAGNVHEGAFSPVDNEIVTVNSEGIARIWDLQTASIRASLDAGKGTAQVGWRIGTAAYSHTGDKIATGTSNGTVRIFGAKTAASLGGIIKHEQGVTSVEFSPNDTRIATTGIDGSVRIWDVEKGDMRQAPLWHNSFVRSAEFDSTGQLLLTASNDGTARLWKLRDQASAEINENREWAPRIRELNLRANRAVLWNGDGPLRVWDLKTGSAIGPAIPSPHDDIDIWISDNGNTVVVADNLQTEERGGKITIWSREGLTTLDMQSPINHVGFSGDGRKIIISLESNQARFYDLIDKKLSKSLPHKRMVLHGTFSPDGKLAATTSQDDTAIVWDVAKESQVSQLPHEFVVIMSSFDSTGQRIVTTSSDHTARVWNAITGVPLTAPLHHAGAVSGGSFDTSGQYVLTYSDDKTARIWNATTGEQVISPVAQPAELRHAEFSDDGRLFLTFSPSGGLQVYDTLTGDPVTPRIREEPGIGSAVFNKATHTIRLITATGSMREIRLEPYAGDLTALMHTAELLSGKRISPSGTVVPLDPAELRQAWQALQARAPDKPSQ